MSKAEFHEAILVVTDAILSIDTLAPEEIEEVFSSILSTSEGDYYNVCDNVRQYISQYIKSK